MGDAVAQGDADDDLTGLSSTLWTDVPRMSMLDSARVHREGLNMGKCAGTFAQQSTRAFDVH